MPRMIRYAVRETVTYERTLEVPDDTPDADLDALFEEDWVQSGDPCTDAVEVRDREVWSVS